jgi:hypothetical protein
MLAPGHAGDNCQLQLCPVCGMCLQMLTIGRNVLSDPSKIIQSARFVQEEVRLQHNETVGVATQPHPASCISSISIQKQHSWHHSQTNRRGSKAGRHHCAD